MFFAGPRKILQHGRILGREKNFPTTLEKNPTMPGALEWHTPMQDATSGFGVESTLCFPNPVTPQGEGPMHNGRISRVSHE